MKLIFLALLFCFNLNLFAAEAIVLVLQAPLLKSPKQNSVVLQYIRKGEKVYIPNETLRNNEILPEFIQTYDRAGNIAFVNSKYIKPITNDDREKLTSVRFGDHDPTDYRIEEPIPSSYPFSNHSYLKTSFALALGNNIKSPYQYQENMQSQDYSSEKGGRFTILKKVSFDHYDRFYFGTLVIFSWTKNYIEFTNQTSSTESRSMVRIGPFLTFDAFKNSQWRVTFGTGFTYNYHKALIQRVGVNNSSEERFFTGFSLSPLVSAFIQYENLVPGMDIIAGSDFNFYLTRNLTAGSAAQVPELWPSDTLHEEMKPQATLYTGVQFRY